MTELTETQAEAQDKLDEVANRRKAITALMAKRRVSGLLIDLEMEIMVREQLPFESDDWLKKSRESQEKILLLRDRILLELMQGYGEK